LLLLTLQTSSALPHYALAGLGERAETFITQLILDGILQVDDGGTILSGAEAFELISGGPGVSEPESRLAVLSRNALEYAANLGSAPSTLLSGRLYMYNRVALSQRWKRTLPDSGAVESYLGVTDRNTVRTLSVGWRRLPAEGAGEVWMAWQSLWAIRPRNAELTYKLYVSPVCEELRAGFSALVRSVAESAAFHFKVGRDVYGLLRPDKMVAYFWDFADLQAAAALLLEKLEGCPAQGVPFTAEIGGEGLISWGVDPPVASQSVPWLERESWRSRVCNLLGTALAVGKTPEFAMERLRVEGIDPGTWAPNSSLAWDASAGA
jgi:hypothetical protein